MPRRKFSGAALPPLAAALPLLAATVRAGTTRAGTWFWGDQALIDLEAHNSLIGRNLLGVYDRYGWHHLGPLWLAVLGVFRWLGAGSSVALVVGNDLVQAAAAAAIVVVATRLRPGLFGWWAALAVLGYEWSFGVERLGTVWAPYAIALPAALLVLLVADIVSSRDPWPPTIGAAICATFLCQTDISTVVVVGALVLVTPVLRLAAGARLRPAGDRARRPGGLWSFQPGWGWATGKWRRSLAVLVVVLVVLWLPPLVQQLTTSPGNVVQVYRFFSKHPGHQPWTSALEAAGTVFGSFPLRLGEKVAKRDSDPAWLVARSLWGRPWYVAYLLVSVGAAVYGFVRRQRAAASLAAATVVAMLAAGWSVHLAYGPLYPYLVLWTGALVVPALTGCWLALTPPSPSRSPSPSRAVPPSRTPRSARDRLAPKAWPAHLVGTPGRPGLVLPALSIAAALAVSGAFGATSDPMAGAPSRSRPAVLGRGGGGRVGTGRQDGLRGHRQRRLHARRRRHRRPGCPPWPAGRSEPGRPVLPGPLLCPPMGGSVNGRRVLRPVRLPSQAGGGAVPGQGRWRTHLHFHVRLHAASEASRGHRGRPAGRGPGGIRG